MGPTEGLVHVAKTLGLGEGTETLTSNPGRQLVAVDLKGDGSAKFRLLDEDVKVRGCAEYRRTSDNVPRPFRDVEKYTLRPGKHRDKYAEIIAEMIKAHPRAKGLQSLQKALHKKQKHPVWLVKLLKESLTVLFIPFFKGRPVFETVARDFEGDNPYADVIFGKNEGREQFDIITGERCVVPKQRPIQIKGLDPDKGSTLMSVNCETTLTMGLTTNNKHLRVPMSIKTMDRHVAGLQWLVDQRRYVQLYGKQKQEGSVRCLAWTTSLEEGAAELFLEVFSNMKRLVLDDVEERVKALKKTSKGESLCVMCIREGKRLQYMAWHYLPVTEALDNLLHYAKTVCRQDGTLLTFDDVLRACAPFQLGLSEERYDFDRHHKAGESRCDSGALLTLLDHIVDGTPFPITIKRRVRYAYTSQYKTDHPSGENHLQNQEALLE